jgi:hypothetical protein
MNDASRSTLEFLCGKLLGDANLTIERNRKPRLRFSHSIKDMDWCFHCYDMLRESIPLFPPKYKKTLDPRVHIGYTEQYYVQSKTSIFLKILKNNGIRTGLKDYLTL